MTNKHDKVKTRKRIQAEHSCDYNIFQRFLVRSTEENLSGKMARGNPMTIWRETKYQIVLMQSRTISKTS